MITVKRKRLHDEIKYDTVNFSSPNGTVWASIQCFPSCCGIAIIHSVFFKSAPEAKLKLYNEFNRWISGKQTGHLNRSIIVMADNTKKSYTLDAYTYGKISEFCSVPRGWHAITKAYNPWSNNNVRMYQKIRHPTKPQNLNNF